MKKYVSIFFIVVTGLQSDWLYWRTEYHTLLNEKVALEEELKQTKFQCKNERDKLSSEIQTLQSNNTALNEELELLKKNREEDKADCGKRIGEIENQITINSSVRACLSAACAANAVWIGRVRAASRACVAGVKRH